MGFGDAQPPATLAAYAGFLLNWLAAGSRRKFEAALGDLGLKLQGFALMNVVATDGGLTQQELVERTHIDPSTMVQTLDALAESGYAERRPHPTDRRKHTIHLTAAGNQILQRARAAAQAVWDESFDRLDAAEREELRRLLRKSVGYDD